VDLERSVEFPTPPALAPVLGATRDGGVTARSSRGLLMTILGEFVLPNGGQAWTQTLVKVMAQMGVQDKAARQAIARMHERGWLDRTRVGRQTRWSLTPSAIELLDAGAERIYAFSRHPRPWDRTWLVLLATVPERDRNVRYRMSTGLSWAGFGSLGQGTWLCPWVGHEPLAVELLTDLGVDATSFRAELGQMGTGPSLARAAWDLPALGAEYESFLVDTTNTAHGEVVGELTALVHRWRRFPFLDPDLPAALLPGDWPGPLAAARFAARRAALLEPATAAWHRAEAEFTPSSG
jgi:phenylacetic acid degradation operon negative regulatory protein